MSEWITPQPSPVPEEFQSLIGGHPLIAQALSRRGFPSAEAARAFLDPGEYQPTPAEELPGIELAGERLERAIQAQESLCVWGDFDVDGQTATTLLVSTFRELGAKVGYYIPVRARESHGVHLPRLQQLIDEGAQVIVTCDTGIAAFEAAAYAQARGVDFIVTDHHELTPELPPAYSITNPQMLPADHPLRTLPGVGVAYKLAEHLLTRMGKAELADSLLDLTALGIVADVALLKGDTRYLLQRGLAALSQPERVGLIALMDAAGLNPVHITEEHIGFMLAPRLNALGRLGDANSIVELLTTQDASRAKIMALELEGLNAQRQLLTNQVFQAALQQLEREPALLEHPVLVLANPTWPAGILGIVASRLVEHYQRPAILISTPPSQPGRGSARSVEGINITQAIAEQADLLVSFGGHAMAAGLAIQPENLAQFRSRLGQAVQRQWGGDRPVNKLVIDGVITLPEISRDLVDEIDRLAPFGPGNPPLILATNNLTLQAKRTIGRTAEHLLLTVQDEFERNQEVIWWQGAGWPIPEGRFDLAYTLHASNFRGQPGIQVQWIEAKPSENQPASLESKPAPVSVQDFRQMPFPQAQLRLIQQDPSVMVWREAEAAGMMAGQNRLELEPNPTLVIWNSPPGRTELQAAIEKVKPTTIILFDQNPGMDHPKAFLGRLAGLAKYALTHHRGTGSLSKFAAATAQRHAAVLAGLDWMQAKGMLGYRLNGKDELVFTGGIAGDPEQIYQADRRLRAILQESAAYRAFFSRADPEGLFGT